MANVQNENSSNRLENMEDSQENDRSSRRGRLRLTSIRRLAKSNPVAITNNETSIAGTSNIDVTGCLDLILYPHLNDHTRTRGRIRLTNVRRLARSFPIAIQHCEASTSGTSNIDGNDSHHVSRLSKSPSILTSHSVASTSHVREAQTAGLILRGTHNKFETNYNENVALSCGVSSNTTKILVKDGSVDREDGVHTKNIVYKEIFLKLKTHQNAA